MNCHSCAGNFRRIGLCFFLLILPAFSGCGITGSGHPVVFQDTGSDLYGYRTPEGETVVPPRYITALEFSEQGIAAAADQNGWKYIDTNGNEMLTPYLYDNGPDYFREGLARFVENGKIGFMDKSGNKTVKARFDFALPFSGGYAAVCNGCAPVPDGEHTRITGGRWGYIDKEGKMVIPPVYDRAEPFSGEKATVILKGHPVTISRPFHPPDITDRFCLSVIYGPGKERKIPLHLLPHKTEIATMDNENPFIRQDGIYCSRDGTYAEGRCSFTDTGGHNWCIRFSADPLDRENRSVLSLIIIKEETVMLQTDFAFIGMPCDMLTMGVAPFCLIGLPLDTDHDDFSICLEPVQNRKE